MNDSPATDWAWSQVSSPNLDFGRTTLTFLALARLADEALNSPQGYTSHAYFEVADAIKEDPGTVLLALESLEKAGSVVRVPTGHFRIPEEAFNRHLAGCGLCVGRPPAFEVSIRQEGTIHKVRACSVCASGLVAEGKAVTLVPIEAVADSVPAEAKGVRV